MALQEVVKEHLTPEKEGESDLDSEYIQEDHETEIRRTNTAARQIQQKILQELWTTVGEAQVLPDAAAKDLVFQVSIFICKTVIPFVDFQFSIYLVYNLEYLYFLFRVSVVSDLDASYRLQWSIIRRGGFSEIYVACTGTNTQHFINLLEGMFGEIDEPDLEDLETEATKEMQDRATMAEEANVAATEGPLPADGVMRVTVTQLPVPLEFGLQPEMYPETESIC